jgi:hypothetical protein
MSGKIKLNAASGGGSVSIQAPSSESNNRTLTLPSDADGTIVSKDTTNNLANIASINGGSIGTTNLVINGAMQVAQRGTSSLANGIRTVDRFALNSAGIDGSPTQAQVDVASGTTPYTLGFRKAFKATNGNQTSGAGAADAIQMSTRIESQDIATSGWNYTSASSFVTFSFWVKSSIAQNFYGYLLTADGTPQQYPFETGTLSADTWTKITKTISGNSNLQFDNNNEVGLKIYISQFLGTDYTDSGVTLNAWGAYGSGDARTLDFTSTWYTTNDATFEITGVQLEVSDHATSFKLEPFQTTHRKCLRYYQKSYSYGVVPGATGVNSGMITGSVSDARTNRLDLGTRFETEFRSNPTMTIYRPLDGAADRLETYGSGNGTSATAGRTFTMRGLGRKGFAGFTLSTSTGGSIGYHYTGESEI